ncbi:voltage-dependent T-type calcium channel subunit alpha-1G isoform X5 [Myzus persicae]|uniref:voltage-dependent T-type calcium channel subunit alpha-1G isoform X5 n=1 Tax=Myzus persicae TaxID=13164 RepID=UPI000B933D23|nr:voltage-dependent T-type calcium channel subunit alpha-1G isoform X5 [Myzus persicae]
MRHSAVGGVEECVYRRTSCNHGLLARSSSDSDLAVVTAGYPGSLDVEAYEDEEEEEEDGEDSEDDRDDDDDCMGAEHNQQEDLPYPGFVSISMKYLDQKSRPRNWCLAMITNPWFERASMLVILLNCVTLGMYQPCVDDQCISRRCRILQVFDDFIFAFFSLEMIVKMIAMGAYGPCTYLADSWNRLDFFIVIAGALEYCLNVENINFSAIRTIRVLRPLRAINRIPSMRILVMLLLDTLPMLGNVLLLCFFVFFIFGIIGVQLWEGILRQRCFLKPLPNVTYPKMLPAYYTLNDEEKDYICSKNDDNGMHSCFDLPPTRGHDALICNATATMALANGSCVNWNYYYTECKSQGENPFQGTISFDNIGLAWVAIFVVISLEGWVDIMYYVQDAHSFWDWIYFVLLIVIGSFFMINLCLVVIATQFSETKKREMERMKMERARFHSTSTLTSSTNNSEPSSCYAQMVKYVAHLWRRGKRKLIKKYRVWMLRRQTEREEKAQRQSATTVALLSLNTNNNDKNVNFIETNDNKYGNGARNGDEESSQPMLRFMDNAQIDSNNAAADPDDQDMTCQELLAISGALSAALPTGQSALTSLLKALGKTGGASVATIVQNVNRTANNSNIHNNNNNHHRNNNRTKRHALMDKQSDGELMMDNDHLESKNKACLTDAVGCLQIYCLVGCSLLRECIKLLVNHRRFQQCILLAILINTLSMGIEYHNQPTELTVIVEYSNIVFSAIFAAEMFLKVIAEGPCGYVSNGFNVFDGIIVILSIVELTQSFENTSGQREGNSGLSVLRTFRLLRILKLVRFMPNLRRQLFVMLRTMDNVAVFFSLLILFIFIFSILGMYLFGGKFCMYGNGARECNCKEIVTKHPLCVCDRKHFNNVLWATVTVFQILTQEDWNIVLFNGMEKTSHWAALYFVTLMTFGNYVLFNLLVAILVEGFSSERNERRERERRELERQQQSSWCKCTCSCYGDDKGDCEFCTEKKSLNGKSSTDLKIENPNRDIITNKCNTHKDTSLVIAPPPPIITHTAATPQDSPNAAHESRDFRRFQSLTPYTFLPFDTNGSGFSIDSIDCSVRSSTNSLQSISKFPKINNRTTQISSPQKLVVNQSFETIPEDVSYSGENGEKLQRRYSWKISRPSLRRKSKFSNAECESDDQGILVLNNNSHSVANSGAGQDHSQCNGAVSKSPSPNFRAANNMLSEYNTIERSPSTVQQSTVNYVLAGCQYDCCQPCDTEGCAGATDDKSSEPCCDCDAESDTAKVNVRKVFYFFEEKGWLKDRAEYSLYIFPPEHGFRQSCGKFIKQKWFDNAVLTFIALNCITLAMERPNIPPDSNERTFLGTANYVFTVVFALEMFVKVVAASMFYGTEPYFKSGWNIMDGLLVVVSIIDLLMSLISESSPKIFGILRVFRLLRSLRPLRVINRAPGLKLVVQTLLSSLRPIGNIVLICCTFFIIFGILGVQLFKGTFFHCEGPNIKHVRDKKECLADKKNAWVNQKYNFDDLGKALMSLFVLSSRDGWVNIMYTGLDAVGVDQQPIENYSEWRLLYFISFILLVGFFVLNMFVGVVVENFHRCREEQEKEERVRRLAKRAKQMEKKRRKMHEPPYYRNYSSARLLVHSVVTSKYFDLAIAAVIGLNVVTMALEFYMMPKALTYALKIFNYFFTAVFILECVMKMLALGLQLYVKDKWNILDIGIVILSIVGITLEELESKIIPINPTIIRVMRVMRIARVLKLLKMAKGIRALLDTVMQALPQVGNLGLLFFLLFFIFAALGVELFGRLECSDEHSCQGLGEHAHFGNFGMAFLTLFRVATGDNWNGIMKDALREDCDNSADCVKNCCVADGIAPMFFVIFVLMAQFVLVNVVVAVLMKHLEESHKQMEDEMDMEDQLEREMAAEEEEQLVQMALDHEYSIQNPLCKEFSLPADFTFKSLPPSPLYQSQGRRFSFNSWSGRMTEPTIVPSQRRRQTVQESNMLVPPALMPTFMIPHFESRNRKLSLSAQPRSDVSRRDSVRSSGSPRPATDQPDAAGQRQHQQQPKQQMQQFTDWQSSANQVQLQARCVSEAIAGGQATGSGNGHPGRGEPAAGVAKNSTGAAVLLAVPATPNPNALAAPPPTPPPSLSKSYITLAIPEECAVDVPLLRSRFPLVRRPEDPTSSVATAAGPVNTLDVRIEASVKRKT